MKNSFLMLFLLCASMTLVAQKTMVTEEQTWFGVFSQTRLSKRWGIWFDAHFRLKDDFVGAAAQGIVRAGPMYYLTDNIRLTAAYAYVHHFPGDNHKNIAQPEHRPWQQIQWFQRGKNARLMQWIRLEERFRRNIVDDNTLGEGYRFNGRIRYNLALFLPLTAKKFAPGGLQVLLNNETMINFGKNIVYNHFDQNRFFLGLVYQVNSHAQLHGGYMNLYQQQASGDVFRNQHTIRVFYFHNFDLRHQ
ncbi:MAG: DUF2490 domain-containing protein [Saprospiraceae bacterium]|nr:DUF2490 domain-containing protein [Saprospiraceae bacterium]